MFYVMPFLSKNISKDLATIIGISIRPYPRGDEK